jgi:hypothetical protein
MQPGLTRAVPMGLLGFLLGAAFVILLRALQSMDPVWDAQIGMMMGGFISLVFFVWGMGAFNPELSAHHAEEPPEGEETALVVHDDHHAHDADYGTDQPDDTPTRVLTGQVWTVTFWTLIVFLIIGAVAATPNLFALTISHDPAATPNAIGYFTLDLGGGNVLVVSQLVALIGLTIFTLLSLLVAGGIISAIMLLLSNGVTQVSQVSHSAQLTAGRETYRPGTATGMTRARMILVPLLAFVVIFIILYVLFYYVFIGLVLPQPESVRVLLSLANAALIALLLVRPRWIVLAVGHGARWLARVLRGLPGGLGQK